MSLLWELQDLGGVLLKINSVHITLNSFLLWVFFHKGFLI
jgi:hypothetical protein